MTEINAKRFNEICAAAREQKDLQLFLAEYDLPEWILQEVTPDEEKAVEIITNIHTLAWMTLKELIAACGLNQSTFSRRFGIALRTVQNWCGGQAKTPRYLVFMVAEIYGLLKVSRKI